MNKFQTTNLNLLVLLRLDIYILLGNCKGNLDFLYLKYNYLNMK